MQLLNGALRPRRGSYPHVDVPEDVVLFSPAEAPAHTARESGLVVTGHRSGGTGPASAGAGALPGRRRTGVNPGRPSRPGRSAPVGHSGRVAP
ncbi:hypothetical protein ACIHIX_37010 [Streptomyces sp. NPDC051913]|uniref:hypothetical protein n=1 Tax=Streptomyces sp. NPDC051913 TaxID=3365676 RepID=UPI0037D7F140